MRKKREERGKRKEGKKERKKERGKKEGDGGKRNKLKVKKNVKKKRLVSSHLASACIAFEFLISSCAALIVFSSFDFALNK